MLKALPSLPAIQAFEAAARLGSFTKAGREIGTTSASVSYHVSRLETQIGVQLFYRASQSVELTDAGKAISRQVTRAFQILHANFTKAKSIDEARLSLTALPTLAGTWLAPRLGKFCADNPAIQVSLDVSPIAEDLMSGQFDCAIRHGVGNWPGLKCHALFPSIFTPLAPPALLPGLAERVLAGGPIGAPLYGRRDWWDAWFKHVGLPPRDDSHDFGPAFATEQLDVASACAAGGVVIASPILFAEQIASGKLKPVFDTASSCGQQIWLCYSVLRRETEKVKKFRRWICDEAGTARRDAQKWIDSVSKNRSARALAHA